MNTSYEKIVPIQDDRKDHENDEPNYRGIKAMPYIIGILIKILLFISIFS